MLPVQQQAGLRGTSVPRVLLNKSILYKLAAYYNNCLLQEGMKYVWSRYGRNSI